MSNRVHILLFGPAATLAGLRTIDLDFADGATVADLRRRLSGEYETLGRGLGRMRIAVNQTFAGDDHPLRHGDEAAVIPPVSGG